MAASIYPVKKSFGPFVLQELAHYKSARRIMKKKKTTWILVLLLWNFESEYTEIERLNGKLRKFQTSSSSRK